MGAPEPRPLVLVVDDNEDQLTMLDAVLEMVGYEVVTAQSLAEARAVFDSRSVDALVSDLALGDGTALQLMHWLGAHRPRVAVVLSGYDGRDHVERSLAAGFDAHLAKPVPVEVLRGIIADGLRQ
jgi:two-component system, NtrC family, response regulator PilR